MHGAAARVVTRTWPFLPGAVVFVLLYGITIARGGRFLYEERFLIMQALDPTALDLYPVPVLLSLHIQPPMMNTLYAVTDANPALLTWLTAAAALSTVLMVVDAVRASGAGARWAASAGALYALLPATVLYSLFPYTTTVTAFFAMLAVWGVSRIGSWQGYAVALSATGMGGLFLTRASFTWWVALAWLGALTVVLVRRRAAWRTASRVVAGVLLAAGALGVVAVQAHYWAAFRLPTLSSWSGENVSNALITVGLSAEAKGRLSEQDPCFAQLVAAGAWAPVETYSACIDPAEPVKGGTPVLENAERRPPSTGLNYNAGARLALADDWTRFVRAALAADPTAVVRVVTGSGEFDGSLSRFLGRSDVYFETLDIPKSTAPALWAALGVWSAAFPYLGWGVVIASLIGAAVSRRFRARLPLAYGFAVALLVIHAVPSILGDYGENHRFRAETDAVLLVTAVLAVWAARQSAMRAASNAATASGSPSTSS